MSASSSPTSHNVVRDFVILLTVMLVVSVSFYAYQLQAQDDLPQEDQQASSDTQPSSMAGAMQVLDELPRDFDALVAQGNQFMDGGNYPMAAELYRRVLEIQDDDGVRVDYGACLNGMGLPVRSIEEFQRVLTGSPDHGIATFNLGIVYYTQQQTDSARHYFNRYLELDPDGRAAPQARQLLQEIAIP